MAGRRTDSERRRNKVSGNLIGLRLWVANKGEGQLRQNTLLICAAFGVVSVSAFAQNDGGMQTGPVLEEIVVTAQRRTESLQTAPISAAILSGDQLQDKEVAQITDLQFASPSLSVSESGIILSVNIRGIGIASTSPNITAGVATYVDGLFQPPIVQSNSFYDLENVEVLRGPQGTFVGSNSTGGAIFINSRDPDPDSFGGYANASYGNYDRATAEGAVNIPLSDTMAARVAGFHRQRDTYYRDVGPFDNDAGKLNEEGGRLGLLWNPGAFQALIKAEINDRRTGGYAYRPIPGTDFAPFRVGDIRTLSFDEPTANQDRALITSLELRYELPSGIVLRSLSGFQHKRINNLYDVDASQAPLSADGDVSQDYFAGEKQYSEEINIISPTDRAFDWIVGGYFQRNDINVEIFEEQGGFPTDILPQNQRTTLGIFAHGGYQITRDLEFQLGARYSHYKAKGSGAVRIGRGIPGFPPDGLQVSDLSGSHDDGRVTGKAALNWRVTEDHLLYGFVARGYKPGGFNSETSEFEPETVWSYEIGWKSGFLDRRLRTQVNAFYNRYNNFQFSIVEPSTGFVGEDNLGKMTMKGFEMQIQALFGGLSLNSNVGYVDSRMDGLTFVNTRNIPSGNLGPQCPQGTPSNPPVCFDYSPFIQTISGGPALYAPKWTFNVGAAYEFVLGNDLTLTPRLNYAYVGKQFTYFAYSPVSDLMAGRGLLSGQLTLQHSRWQLEIYGTNLTNKKYVSGQFGSNEFYGAPREYGMRVGVTF